MMFTLLAIGAVAVAAVATPIAVYMGITAQNAEKTPRTDSSEQVSTELKPVIGSPN